MASDKESIRKSVRERLRALSLEDQLAFGAEIEAAVWTIDEVKSASVVLLYASMGSEVPTDTLAAEARRRGIRIAYPRCEEEGCTMTLHEVGDGGALAAGGPLAIREPSLDAPRISVEEVDVAFIPGLAWDRNGGRLGRGGGYYDRILADPSWRALKCGLFYGLQEVPAVPRDSWDIRLDVVVTERDVVRFD